MCRAVWIIVVAPTEDARKALRRAAGPEAQVVGMAGSIDDARALLESSPVDAIVIDGATPGARDLDPGTAALLWFGDDASERAHATAADLDSVESALTRALIARAR